MYMIPFSPFVLLLYTHDHHNLAAVATGGGYVGYKVYRRWRARQSSVSQALRNDLIVLVN